MNRRGIGAALLSALLFGLSAPLAQGLVARAGPWMVAGLLYLGAGLGLAVLAALRRRAGPPLVRADLPWLAGIVVAGGLVGPVLLMFGLAATDAASASLLLNLESVATLTIAWLVFRENVDGRLMLGAAALLAGAVLLSWQGGARLDPGALLVAGACLAWGIDNNLTRRLSHADPVQLAMIKGLVAGSVNLGLALWLGAVWPAPGMALTAMGLGLVGIGISLVLFIFALSQLGAARAGAYYATAPFAGALAAVALLGAPLTWPLLLAGGLMALGVWLHLTERHEHDHAHQDVTHEHRHRHDDGHHAHDHAPGIDPRQPHSHVHSHAALVHRHAHYPDLHHRHDHGEAPTH